jgi:hypothetical protein
MMIEIGPNLLHLMGGIAFFTIFVLVLVGVYKLIIHR